MHRIWIKYMLVNRSLSSLAWAKPKAPAPAGPVPSLTCSASSARWADRESLHLTSLALDLLLIVHLNYKKSYLAFLYSGFLTAHPSWQNLSWRNIWNINQYYITISRQSAKVSSAAKIIFEILPRRSDKTHDYAVCTARASHEGVNTCCDNKLQSAKGARRGGVWSRGVVRSPISDLFFCQQFRHFLVAIDKWIRKSDDPFCVFFGGFVVVPTHTPL